MDQKTLPVDQLALRFSTEIVKHVRAWMDANYAEDLDFHKYRMRLLTSLGEDNSAKEKLENLLDKILTKLRFDLIEAISDKTMGEAIAKFIFSKIIISLNEEYHKILEYEADRVKSEIHILNEKASGLKTKIGQH